MEGESALRHLPNLDGLRTLAAFSVVVTHCNAFAAIDADQFWGGDWTKQVLFGQARLGVQFFFVLSGFLITTIALQEAKIDIRRFWLRRILRIWPVYFLVVAVGFLASLTPWPIYAMDNNNWALLLCFLENFDIIPLFRDNIPFGYIVSVLWSVSIEEQFYFIYPILLALLPRRFYLPFFSLIVAGALCYRLHPAVEPFSKQFGSLAACYELGLGCLLAMAFRPIPRPTLPRPLLLVPYALLLASILWNHQSATLDLGRPLLFCMILFDQAFCPQSWLQTRFIPGLNSLGKITYGIYAYHIGLAILINQIMASYSKAPRTVPLFLLYLLLVSLCTVAISSLSYRFMERPLMGLAPRKN